MDRVYWLLISLTPTPPPPIPQPFQIINNLPAQAPKGLWEIWAQPLATVAAAIAAITAALITVYVAYRNRRQLRDQFGQSHELEIVRGLNDRYTAIGAQLADPSVTVRSAGAHALAALADDWLARKSPDDVIACISLLCSYLRSPYSPPEDHTKIGLRKTIRKKTAEGEVIEEHYHHGQDDLEVRQDIARKINLHLRPDSVPSWDGFPFDFTGAYFRDVTFAECVFSGGADFTNATFTGFCDFTETKFEDAIFRKTRFSTGAAVFVGATFAGVATTFNGATFRGLFADFSRARFESESVDFGEVDWEAFSVRFPEVTIGQNVEFIAGPRPGFLTPDLWPPENGKSTDDKDAGSEVLTGDPSPDALDA